MKSVNPIIEKKVKEIIGDSTGREAALKILEYYNKKSSYRVYGTSPRYGKTFTQQLEEERKKKLNCSDRIHR